MTRFRNNFSDSSEGDGKSNQDRFEDTKIADIVFGRTLNEMDQTEKYEVPDEDESLKRDDDRMSLSQLQASVQDVNYTFRNFPQATEGIRRIDDGHIFIDKGNDNVKQNLIAEFDKHNNDENREVIQELKKKIKELETAYKQQQEEFDRKYEDELAKTLKQNQDDFENRFDQIKQEKDLLNNEIKQKNQEIDNFKNQIDQKDQEIINLKQQNDQKDTIIEKQSKNQKDDDEEKSKTINDQNELINNLKEQNTNLKAQLSELPTNNKIQEIYK